MRQATRLVTGLVVAYGLMQAPAFGALGDLLQTIQKPTPVTGDSFGQWVETVGNNILVGAYMDNTGATNAGAAYLFDPNGILLQTFQNPTPAIDDGFGRCVVGVGGNILVGAYGDDTGATDAGAAYLFDANGVLLQTFQKPTPAASDYFGRSVAAVGDNILVGADWDDTGATDSGAVYLFDANGTLLQTILNPTPAADDWFGYSVAAVGNNILVGAYYDDTGATDAGAAYLFDANGILLQTFQKPTPAAGDQFGLSVAAVGNNILVGANKDDTGATNAGAAYLFDANGILLQTFQNPTPEVGDEFGISVAAVGDDILVSAPYNNTGGTDAGAAYLFDANGILLQTFHKPTPAASDYFGCNVAALGNNILVGAHWDDTGATNSGAVYLFEGVPEPASAAILLAGASLLIKRRRRRR